MGHNEMQFLLFLERARFWQTLINSGAYKSRKTQRVSGKDDHGAFTWRDCTDEEKLADAVGTVQRHLEHASKFADAIADEPAHRTEPVK